MKKLLAQSTLVAGMKRGSAEVRLVEATKKELQQAAATEDDPILHMPIPDPSTLHMAPPAKKKKTSKGAGKAKGSCAGKASSSSCAKANSSSSSSSSSDDE